MSATPEDPRAVELTYGRVLDAWDGGDPAGRPVLYHHGTPMAGVLYEKHASDAAERGIRLIGYSRPGYGGSTSQPGRSVGDAAADAAALADALGFERFATWGISGGGPHALACAALLPERVVAAASVAGVVPWGAEAIDFLDGMGEDNHIEFGAAREGREPLRALLEPHADALLHEGPNTFHERFATLLSRVDAAVLTGDLAAYMYRCNVAGLERGVDGWLDDDLAFIKPWGFEVQDIRVPTLVVHGGADQFVPPSHGRWLADRIPQADAWLIPDDGHLTLIEHRVPDVHAWLLERFDR